MPDRPISIANRHPRLRLDRRAVTGAIRTLDTSHSAFVIRDPAFLSGELSLVFLTDAALAQLHADFLDDPTPTDVITFEGNPALGLAGEICVSADAAARQVGPDLRAGRKTRARSKSNHTARAAAFSAELTLYLVHGWLHLAGYDDLQPTKKRAMRRAEARAMKLLRSDGDGLPEFSLRR